MQMFCLPGEELDTFKIRKILSESIVHTYKHFPAA